MTTTTAPAPSAYDPALDLSLVRPHTKNPRRSAQADDELVSSVKASGLVQPIIVAPDPTDAGHFVLLAGHRRHDACTKAGMSTAPAVIRTDLLTDGQQLEAMLVENGRRLDLTPIEEAEGYQELTLFGYKQKDIARAVGRSASTVSSRMRLLHLNEDTRSNVHDGQISLDDALAMTQHTGTDLTLLEDSAGKPGFRYALEAANRRKAGRDAYDAKVKDLAAAGVAPYAQNVDDRTDTWALQRSGDLTRLYTSIADSKSEHPHCLSWCREVQSDGVPCVILVCTDPDTHLDPAEPNAGAGVRGEDTVYLPGDAAIAAEDRLAAEKARQDRIEEARVQREAEEIAASVRLSTLLDQIKPGIKLDKHLSATVRALLPPYIEHLENGDIGPYWSAIGLEDPPGWNDDHSGHMGIVDAMSDYQVARALVGLLVAGVDWLVGEDHNDRFRAGAVRYYDHLIAADHPMSDVDEACYAIARGAQADEEEADE